MTLDEATALFLEYTRCCDSTLHLQLHSAIHDQTLSLLALYFSTDTALADITPEDLRDFLSRWYVDRAGASKAADSGPAVREEQSTATRISQPLVNPVAGAVPEPDDLLHSLSEFFKWADREAGTYRSAQYTPILEELSRNLPRALEITHALSRSLRERGGAFTFPEFLTSFEEGGSSQYDIDVPGNIGAIDGYFRISRVEGSSVEAEDLISEKSVWPIIFPSQIASLLEEGDIINLELVCKPEGWQIAGCGFAYPPRTEI